MATERRQTITVTTTNATVQTINIGSLGAAGRAVGFELYLSGIRTDLAGQMGLYFKSRGQGAQNGIGVGFNAAVIGPTGFTDAAAVSWTTLGVPAGWAAAVAFAGTVLQLQWNGAAGQTVVWTGYVHSFYLNGATV